MRRERPTEEQVKAIVDAHLRADIAEHRVVHHHCNTHVYVTTDRGERVVIRVCDGPWWTEEEAKAWKFRREQIGWSFMSKLEGVSVPHVLVIDTSKAQVPYPYLVMTHVPGQPMSEVLPELNTTDKLDLIRQLGEVVGRIHALSFDPESMPEEAVRWGGARESIRENLVTLTEDGRMTPRAARRVEELLDVYDSLLTEAEEAKVFLHGDIAFRNTHVQRSSGRWQVTGLVDGELSGFGPRGRELRVLEPLDFRPLALPGMRAAFLDGYGPRFSRTAYKLAYLDVELCPMYPNEVLLAKIDSPEFSDDLDWLDVF